MVYIDKNTHWKKNVLPICSAAMLKVISISSAFEMYDDPEVNPMKIKWNGSEYAQAYNGFTIIFWKEMQIDRSLDKIYILESRVRSLISTLPSPYSFYAV